MDDKLYTHPTSDNQGPFQDTAVQFLGHPSETKGRTPVKTSSPEELKKACGMNNLLIHKVGMGDKSYSLLRVMEG